MIIDTDELERLALRCEQADGPDRELACRIAENLGWTHCWFSEAITSPLGCAPGTDYEQPIPRWDASLDAALTLVADGLALRGLGEGKSGLWIADLVEREPRRHVAIGSGQTPALALTAAALRARASCLARAATQRNRPRRPPTSSGGTLSHVRT